MRRFSTAALLLLTACHPGGPPGEFATRQQIIDAAARCGIENFEPTRAGAEWTALVSPSVPDAEVKAGCIYADIHAQGLLITR